MKEILIGLLTGIPIVFILFKLFEFPGEHNLMGYFLLILLSIPVLILAYILGSVIKNSFC
jgi:hypothetical protein